MAGGLMAGGLVAGRPAARADDGARDPLPLRPPQESARGLARPHRRRHARDSLRAGVEPRSQPARARVRPILEPGVRSPVRAS
eukprot:1911732-Prymnesium_polylepis.1